MFLCILNSKVDYLEPGACDSPHIDALTQASIGMRLPVLWYVHVLCGMCNVQCLTYEYPAIACLISLLYISCTYTHNYHSTSDK